MTYHRLIITYTTNINQHYHHHEPERRPSCCASASIAKERGEDVSAGRSMVKAIWVGNSWKSLPTKPRVASWKGDTKWQKMLCACKSRNMYMYKYIYIYTSTYYRDLHVIEKIILSNAFDTKYNVW